MLKLEPILEAFARAGRRRSQGYADIDGGLFPPVVKLGSRSFVPQVEVDAVIRARIAGKSDDEVRTIVKTLIAERTAA